MVRPESDCDIVDRGSGGPARATKLPPRGGAPCAPPPPSRCRHQTLSYRIRSKPRSACRLIVCVVFTSAALIVACSATALYRGFRSCTATAIVNRIYSQRMAFGSPPLSFCRPKTFRSKLNGWSLLTGVAPPAPLEDSGGTVTPPSPGSMGPTDVKGKARSTTVVAASKRGKRRRGGVGQVKFHPRPRGADGGPLRTPQHIGDAWQSEESYEVEKVIVALQF
jgi:hypothetical protein